MLIVMCRFVYLLTGMQRIQQTKQTYKKIFLHNTISSAISKPLFFSLIILPAIKPPATHTQSHSPTHLHHMQQHDSSFSSSTSSTPAVPLTITSCPSCPQPCLHPHVSTTLHTTINALHLESRLQTILAQNSDQWLELYQKIETKLQGFVDEVMEYLDQLEESFGLYKGVVVLGGREEGVKEGNGVKEEEGKGLMEAVRKVTDFRYEQLTCGDIERVVKAVDRVDMKNEDVKNRKINGKKQLEAQFRAMEEKVDWDMMKILSKNFGYQIGNKTSNHPIIPNNSNITNHLQTNQQTKQQTKEFQPQIIVQKMQQILQQQIKKIKPLIQKEILKAKSAPIEKEQTKNHLEAKDSTRIKEEKPWEEKKANNRDRQETITTTKREEQKPTHPNTPPPQFLKIARIKFYPNSIFHCTVKVLSIIKLDQLYNQKTYTRFLAGDQSGAAVFLLPPNRLFQPGNTLEIKFVQAQKFAGFCDEIMVFWTKEMMVSLAKEDSIKFVGPFMLCETAKKTFHLLSDQDLHKLMPRERGNANKKSNDSQPTTTKPIYLPKQKDPEQKYDLKKDQKSDQKKSHYISKKIKISSIQPCTKNYHIQGQVKKIIQIKNNKIIFVLGDETGIVQCEAPEDLCFDLIKHGKIAQLVNFDAVVENGYIVMKMSEKGNIRRGNLAPPFLDSKNNISNRKIL